MKYFLFLIFIPLAAPAQDTLRLSLQEATEMALINNENLAQAVFNQGIVERQYLTSIGQYLPNFGFTANYTRNLKLPVIFLPEDSPFGGGQGGVLQVGNRNSITANLQGNAPIFNKALIENIQAARINRQLAQLNYEAEANDLKADVRTAFFDALVARELLSVQEFRLNTTEQNLNIIELQFNEGIVAEYDYLRAQVNVENIRPNITEALNNYSAILNQLKVLLALPVDQTLILEGTLADYAEFISPEVLQAYSVARNPNLRAMDIQHELQEVQIDIQQAAYYPSLSAFGNYQYQAQSNDFNVSEYQWVETSSVGLSIDWSIFQGLTRVHQVEIARINLDIIQEQYSFLNRNLEAQAENSINTVQRSLQNMQVQQRNVSLAERAYNIARISYQNGVADLLELNDAELALAESRVNYLSSVQQYLIALVEFQRVIGEDIIEFSLE